MTTQPFAERDKTKIVEKLVTNEDVVLDVGFWGQGITATSEHWPHRLILDRAKEVYGVDLVYDERHMENLDVSHYQKAAAEDFKFERKFSLIFAGDLIEHLINPGLFLDNARKHLNEEGRLIITTPNTFNLFNLAGKLTRPEPVVNSDHTAYHNIRTLRVLLEKCGWEVKEFGYMYTLDYAHKESFKKIILNLIYKFLSLFTPKFYETLVVVAIPKK